MFTRREFLKVLSLSVGGAVASAWAPALGPGLTVAAAEPTPTATGVLAPTATHKPPSTATATATGTPKATATVKPATLVEVRGDQFYFEGERYPIKGFNYYPKMHPWRTFNLGDWEPGATERELVLASNLGANTVRIFIDYQYSLDNIKAQQSRDTYFAPIAEYVENVREFLTIADRYGIKTIVTLFDSMDWSIYQPASHWIAEEYVRAFVPPFVNDPRILCWDLQNEPDRAITIVGNTAVIPFFQKISALVRKMDPRHLQTIGWIDRARGKYFPDLETYLDFWCFHFYDKADTLNALVRFYKGKTTRPVLLEEYGLATGGPGANGNNTEADQAAHYATVMNVLENNKMCGSVFWALVDFPQGLAGNPPSPNDSPENHFGVFRLDYSEKPAALELRKRWLPRRELFQVPL